MAFRDASEPRDYFYEYSGTQDALAIVYAVADALGHEVLNYAMPY